MKTKKKQAAPVSPTKPSRKPPKSRVLGVRLLLADIARLNAAAEAAGKNGSDWARLVILDGLTLAEIPPQVNQPPLLFPIVTMSREEFANQYPPQLPPVRRIEILMGPTLSHPPGTCGRYPTWSSEFAAMQEMEPAEAMGRFKELLGGRALPKGFVRLSRPEQVRWLEKEMPL